MGLLPEIRELGQPRRRGKCLLSGPHGSRWYHEAGGVASLAHPGVAGRDDLIPALVAAGLDALEAYHTDHDPETTTRYLGMADRLGVAVSGGSDYHADESHGGAGPGSVALPPDRYETLKSRRRR